MYLEHFGLREPPFRITPHTEFFYQGAARGATLDGLVYAVLHEEGLVKVIGEVGAGKTMLCRVLLERLPEHVETAYLANPSLSRHEVVLAIAAELDIRLEPSDPLPLRTLQEALVARFAAGRQVVVLIDEAHAMPAESLEEIRLLSNLEHGHHKLLQIVFFGQPELDDALASKHMRQLRERITHSFSLPPLKQADVGEYLMFRLRAAGYRGPDLFTPRAIRRIAEVSEGLTRRINILADKALLASFAVGRHQVDRREVDAAVQDSTFRPTPDRWRHALLATLLAGTGLVGSLAWAHWMRQAAAPPATRATHPAMAAPPVADHPTPVPALAPSMAQAKAATPAENLPPLLAARRAVGDAVLAQPALRFTLQLATLKDLQPTALDMQIRRMAQHVALDGLFLQPISGPQGEAWYGLFFGAYASEAEAAQALAALPAAVRRDRPMLRSLGALRAATSKQEQPRTGKNT
jgi:type II secretory pathway predicted ATPase ExeA